MGCSWSDYKASYDADRLATVADDGGDSQMTLGEWLIGDAHYVHKDEHLANIRRRGGLELYSSTDIFFGEVCLLSEVCRNSDKLFQIEAGEEFECDAEPSALLGGFLDAARRLGTAARKKRKS